MPHQSTLNIATDPTEVAKLAHLHYVSDENAGFQRQRRGEGFVYLDTSGKPIKDAQQLERFKALGIPPAWTDVWICPSPNGHIQATGRDARGRKQYRYHPRWREVRSQNNFGRMLLFGEHLPHIRERVVHDLARHGLARERVLALVVSLLEMAHVRVGNVEYARDNQSFGLTTMRDRHVEVSGSTIRFEFKGKSARWHSVKLTDRRLAKMVKRCRDIPGQELFQYYDQDGQRHSVGSADVNAYLREITEEDFTAKDFRTWSGTVMAVKALCECEPYEDEKQAQKNIVQSVKEVAQGLGNTAAVCRKYYISPVILDAYLNGKLLEAWKRHMNHPNGTSRFALDPAEQMVMWLLKNA